MSLEKLKLDGRVAVITGAGRGLGREMALTFAKAGADIVAAARTVSEIEETAHMAAGLGRKAIAVKTNVTNSQEVNHLAEVALAEFGKIDILVNNAGGGGGTGVPAGATIVDITDEAWHSGLDASLAGAFYCTRAFASALLAQRRGKVIIISSLYGTRGGKNNYMYCIAKGGLLQLTRSLALTWAQENIQVNCILPGFFATRMILGPSGDRAAARDASRFKFIPTGDVGKPEEIGPLALYLASDASNYVTGSFFITDGGSFVAGYAPTNFAPVIPLEEVE